MMTASLALRLNDITNCSSKGKGHNLSSNVDTGPASQLPPVSYIKFRMLCKAYDCGELSRYAMSEAKFRSTPKFRPSSAPAGRPKSASTARNAQDNDEKHKRSGASISIAYLRNAAEKKKARDREFAVGAISCDSLYYSIIISHILLLVVIITARALSRGERVQEEDFGQDRAGKQNDDRHWQLQVIRTSSCTMKSTVSELCLLDCVLTRYYLLIVVIAGPRWHSHDQGPRPRGRRPRHLRRDLSYPLPALFIYLFFLHDFMVDALFKLS